MNFEDPFKQEREAAEMGGTLTVENLEQQVGLTPKEIDRFMEELGEIDIEDNDAVLDYFRAVARDLEESK